MGISDFMIESELYGTDIAAAREATRSLSNAAYDDEDDDKKKKKLAEKYTKSTDEELEDKRAKYAQARENVKYSEKSNWAPDRNTVLEDHLSTIETEQRQRRIDKAFDSAGRGIRDFAKHAWKNWPGKGKR